MAAVGIAAIATIYRLPRETRAPMVRGPAPAGKPICRAFQPYARYRRLFSGACFETRSCGSLLSMRAVLDGIKIVLTLRSGPELVEGPRLEGSAHQQQRAQRQRAGGPAVIGEGAECLEIVAAEIAHQEGGAEIGGGGVDGARQPHHRGEDGRHAGGAKMH